MKPDRADRVLLLLAPAMIAGTAAVATAGRVEPRLVALALQCVAVCAFVLMAWRVGTRYRDARAVRASTPALVTQLAPDRRLPSFDRNTGLCANWYFRMRVEEEMARADRFGQPFTILRVCGETEEAVASIRRAARRSLRQIDLAGSLDAGAALLLPGTTRAAADAVVTRLARCAAGVTIQAAEYPSDANTFEALLGQQAWEADAAAA